MKEYKCPNCDQIGYIKSVEKEIHQYTISPDENGHKEYDSTNSKCIYGEFETILCAYCDAEFSEGQLNDMIVDVEEEQ